MRRTLSGLMIGLGLALLAGGDACAQTLGATNIGADPFSLYYSFYLPNQAYQAMQPRVEDTINTVTAVRQYNGFAERAGMFNEPSESLDEEDPFRPYGSRRGGAGRRPVFQPGADTNAVRGLGPTMYYNRVMQYYPRMPAGRGANRNVVTLRARGRSMGGMGGMGMPSMGPR